MTLFISILLVVSSVANILVSLRIKSLKKELRQMHSIAATQRKVIDDNDLAVG
jgi:hypothetical protein